MSVSRRAREFSTQLSYTLSKSEDTGASALGGNDFDGEGAGSRYLFTADKGLSPFDVRQSFVASLTYLLPFGQNGSGFVSHLIRGWELGTLVRLRSGQPFSAFVGYDQSLQVWAPVYPDLAPGASANPVLGGPDKVLRSGGVRAACSGRRWQRAAQLAHRPRLCDVGSDDITPHRHRVVG